MNNLEMSTCRCCLIESSYKDISSDYCVSGQKDVYEDMLRDTFNIHISHWEHSNIHLICEGCIVRLRDAHEFKQMVLQSEERLIDDFNRCERSDVKSESGVKVEKLELVQEFNNEDHYQNDSSLDDDEILANIKSELNGNGDCQLKRKKHSNTKRPKRSRKRSKMEEDCAGVRQEHWKTSEREDTGRGVRGNIPLLRKNSLKLIANSTMCVFQWNKSRYRCFCCLEPFSDMDTLREHTSNKHTIKNIEKKIIVQQNKLVKVEVSLLLCKICNKSIENLDNLRSHLENAHDFTFELNEDLLVPFKISAKGHLQCQICSETFTMFRLLNIHMNRHYQKQVCHICGAGFSNAVFLNLHKTRSHRPLSCKTCDLTFKSKTEKRQHDVESHDLKVEKKFRFPCPYCSERYYQENLRVQHLVDKHGMDKPEYKCSMCPKVFITKSLCNNHVKCVHMKERKYECDLCHHTFYSKSDLERHRVTHTGEKKFSCALCNNPFATRDSLRRHLKRTHNGLQ